MPHQPCKNLLVSQECARLIEEYWDWRWGEWYYGTEQDTDQCMGVVINGLQYAEEYYAGIHEDDDC